MNMKSEYDFAAMRPRKIRVTINLDPAVVRFFKKKAEETGGKYQTLINNALRHYARSEQDHEVVGNLKANLLADRDFLTKVADALPR